MENKNRRRPYVLTAGVLSVIAVLFLLPLRTFTFASTQMPSQKPPKRASSPLGDWILELIVQDLVNSPDFLYWARLHKTLGTAVAMQVDPGAARPDPEDKGVDHGLLKLITTELEDFQTTFQRDTGKRGDLVAVVANLAGPRTKWSQPPGETTRMRRIIAAEETSVRAAGSNLEKGVVLVVYGRVTEGSSCREDVSFVFVGRTNGNSLVRTKEISFISERIGSPWRIATKGARK